MIVLPRKVYEAFERHARSIKGSGRVAMNENWKVQLEQAEAGMRDITPVAAQLFHGLRENGVGRFEAAFAVGVWIATSGAQGEGQ